MYRAELGQISLKMHPTFEHSRFTQRNMRMGGEQGYQDVSMEAPVPSLFTRYKGVTYHDSVVQISNMVSVQLLCHCDERGENISID